MFRMHHAFCYIISKLCPDLYKKRTMLMEKDSDAFNVTSTKSGYICGLLIKGKEGMLWRLKTLATALSQASLPE